MIIILQIFVFLSLFEIRSHANERPPLSNSIEEEIKSCILNSSPNSLQTLINQGGLPSSAPRLLETMHSILDELQRCKNIINEDGIVNNLEEQAKLTKDPITRNFRLHLQKLLGYHIDSNFIDNAEYLLIKDHLQQLFTNTALIVMILKTSLSHHEGSVLSLQPDLPILFTLRDWQMAQRITLFLD